jgi:hypothetical protein
MSSWLVSSVGAGPVGRRGRRSHFCAVDLFGGRSDTVATRLGRGGCCADVVGPLHHSHLVLTDSVRLAYPAFSKHPRFGLRVHADGKALYLESHGRSERADLEQYGWACVSFVRVSPTGFLEFDGGPPAETQLFRIVGGRELEDERRGKHRAGLSSGWEFEFGCECFTRERERGSNHFY